MASGTSGRDGLPVRDGWLYYAWLFPAVLAAMVTVLLCWSATRTGHRFALIRPAWLRTRLGPGQDLTLLVTSVLWVASLAAYWGPRRFRRQPIALIAIVSMVIIGGALSTASLVPCRDGMTDTGVLGWLLDLYLGQPPGAYPGAGCMSQVQPLALQLGAIVCPGATLITALTVGAVLWREPVGRMRSRFASDAVVFTGLDPQTLPLLRRLARDARSPRDIIVIEPDEKHVLLEEARLTGARVIIGNPASARLLQPIICGLRGCALSQLYALSAKVQENEAVVEAATKILLRYRGDQMDLASQPHLFALVNDPRHADAWRGSHGGTSDSWFEDALSSVESTACGLVSQVMATGARDLLLCGDSDLALATLIELARRAWELAELEKAAVTGREAMPTSAPAPPAMPVERVLLVDSRAEDIRREYLASVPPAVQDSGPAVLPHPVRWREHLLPMLDAARDRGTAGQVVVAIVDDGDENRQHEGGRVARLHPRTPVFVLAAPGEGISQRIFGRLTSFERGLLVDGQVPEDIWTRIARHWHECYRLSRPIEPGDPRTATRLPWASLDRSNRQINIRQLRSIMTQVAVLGRQWAPVRDVPPGSFIELSETEFEAIAEAAHTRWYRQRIAEGWSAGPSAAAAASRTNKLLVPWDKLPDSERESGKDRARTQVAQLEEVGFMPVVPPGGPPDARSFQRHGIVHARRLTAPLRWTVPSGEEMHGNPGDWRVVDSTGALRTVTDPDFQSSHEPLGNGRWHRTGTVTAWPAAEAVRIRTKEGNATAQPGDWIVEGPAGERWPISDDQFQASYRARADRPDTAGQASTTTAISSTTAPTISS
jgi:hypothetical protein